MAFGSLYRQDCEWLISEVSRLQGLVYNAHNLEYDCFCVDCELGRAEREVVESGPA